MKTVVNVRTRKEWNEVTKKLGYIWMMSEWNNYKENSCICLHGNSYSSMEYFKKEGYKIISYDKFMGNKNKEYKLIITPTNKTIIIDTETGKKGMARLHPDDEYDFLEGVKVAMDKLNGVESKKEEVKKSILSEPEFKKCKIINVGKYYDAYREFANYFELNNWVAECMLLKNNDICNVIGYAKHFETNDILYVVEKNNQQFIIGVDGIEKYEPKLYDSFGEELKEGDRFVLIDLERNKNCTSDFSYVKLDGEELYSNGIRIHHNSKYNNGKPKNRWKVIKVK